MLRAVETLCFCKPISIGIDSFCLKKLQSVNLHRNLTRGGQFWMQNNMDRLMHRSALLKFEGRSYRLKELATRITQPDQQTA